MMFKEAAMMSSEVMALSKSKNLCKSRAELPKNGRVFVDGIGIVRRMPVLVSSTFEDFQLFMKGKFDAYVM
jgi:hypothetical protein